MTSFGRRVSVECWPGDGAPLVLLHGLLDCAVGWKQLAAVMHRPCFAVDLPGFGDSDRPTRNRISAYTEDVKAALAAVDVHDFTLVGHSFGGAVAAGLAERLRDEVAALVLIAPVGFGRIATGRAARARFGFGVFWWLPAALPWVVPWQWVSLQVGDGYSRAIMAAAARSRST
jgi:pimeloyl-ACP methyl ester carboxylesterase